MFKYINKNKKRSILMIPGWATDFRVFDLFLDSCLCYNYIFPVDFSPFKLVNDIFDFLKTEFKGQKVSIFGWSMGAFIAQDFASQYPEFIDELILGSVRKKYIKEEIDFIREALSRKKDAYLYSFYSKCFYDRANFLKFKKDYMDYYFKTLSLENLLEGLDYLEAAEFKPELLKSIDDIRIINGENDKIAPMIDLDIEEVERECPHAEIRILKDAGHMFFMEKEKIL